MSLSRWDIINKEYTTQILNPVFVTIESHQKKKKNGVWQLLILHLVL